MRLWMIVSIGILLPASAASGQTVQEVIASHAKALGGSEAMGKVKDRVDRWSLTVETSQATGTGTLVVHTKGPHKYREVLQVEFGENKIRVVQGYDGETAWRVSQGKLAVLEGDELAAMRNRASRSVGADLFRPKEVGAKIALKGKEEVDGRNTYVLKVTPREGREITYYVDAASYLVVKTSTSSATQGVESDVQQWPFDYREVQGVRIAYGLEVQRTFEGTDQEQRFVLTRQKVVFNTGLEDTIFAPPDRPRPDKKRRWY